MKTLFGLCAVLSAIILATGSTEAQIQVKKIQVQPKQVQIQPKLIAQGSAVDNKLVLLGVKGVQDELKLTADQVKAVTEMTKRFNDAVKNLKPREAAQASRDLIQQNHVAIAKLLSKEQNGRLGQLEVQQKGPSALVDPQVSKDLNLTDAQRTQVQQSIRESVKERNQITRDNKGNEQKLQEKLGELNKSVMENLVKGLTDGQRGLWKTMVGEPFRGTLPAVRATGIGVIRPGVINPNIQLPPVQKLPVQKQ